METDFAPVISDMSKELKNFTKESNATLEKLDQKAAETSARLLAIEQRLVARGAGGGGGLEDPSDIGNTIVNSDGFKRLQAENTQRLENSCDPQMVVIASRQPPPRLR
jgi:hypothetical protein